METEKAIEILERRTTIPDEEFSFAEIMQAIDMAIKALRKEVDSYDERCTD